MSRKQVGRKRRQYRTRVTNPRRPEKFGRNPRIPEAVTVEREERAWHLYTREGKTQREIAAVLGVSQPAVCQALRRVEDRTLEVLKDETLREKARQQARLEAIYLEALGAWHKSVAGFKRTSERRTGDGKRRRKGAAAGTASSSSTTVDVKHGDPRFLEKALSALADLRKLLGIDAPTKFEGKFETKTRPLENLTPEELKREIAQGQQLLKELGVTIH